VGEVKRFLYDLATGVAGDGVEAHGNREEAIAKKPLVLGEDDSGALPCEAGVA
jgi:hypothetical protein